MHTEIPEGDEQLVDTPEQEAPVEQSENASPEELGVGRRLSNEPFSPIDFDSIIEKAATEVAKPTEDQQPATEVVADKKEEAVSEQPKEEVAEAKEEPAKTEEAPKAEVKDEAKEKQTETTQKAPETDAEIEAIEKKMGPHSAPKTKQLFNEVKAIASRERAEREKAQSELNQLREQLKNQQQTSNKLPKEVEEEIAALRDKVRQFDANADPAIVAKYDKNINANNDGIIKTLTDAGLPAEHAERLKKNGVTLANLKPYLDTLESGKGADGKQYEADPDTAEKIREMLRENIRLSKDKDREINDWRTSYDSRMKQAEEDNKRQVEEATVRLNSEFDSHIKKWDFLQKPADVADADAPAIRKQKEAAINTYNEKSLKYAEAVKKETATPMDAQIAARIGILYRDHVAPTLMSKLDAASKQIKDLETQIQNMKKAGSASKTIGANKVAPTAKKEAVGNEGFDDIIDDIARQVAGNQQ